MNLKPPYPKGKGLVLGPENPHVPHGLGVLCLCPWISVKWSVVLSP